MTKARLSIWAAIGLTLSSNALASDWRMAAQSSNKTILMIDIESIRELPPVSIRRPFVVRQAWVKYDFKFAKRREREAVVLANFNCEDLTSHTISYTSYLPDGSVYRSWKNEDYEFHYEPVVRDSVLEEVLQIACR